MAEIRLEANSVYFAFDHYYLVFVDDGGNEFVIRGGPGIYGPDSNSVFGPITVEAGVPIAESRDFREVSDRVDVNGSVVIDLGWRDATDVWAIMVQAARNIDAANIDYAPFGSNSNSTVNSVLHAVGIDIADIGFNAVGFDNFPGQNDSLLDDYVRNLSSEGVGASEDIIFGGNLNDLINSGAGDDLVNGGAGADQITGGDGVDLVSFVGSTAITIELRRFSDIGFGTGGGR